MSMIEMSWHNLYVNVLRRDCKPCVMHKSRCFASYLAYSSIVAYSCVQRPMYIYEACFSSYFGLFDLGVLSISVSSYATLIIYVFFQSPVNYYCQLIDDMVRRVQSTGSRSLR